METKQLELTVTEGLTVTVLPDSNHEYLMTSREVESGYGVTEHALRMSRLRNASELLEGKHFVTGKGVTNCYPGLQIQPHAIFWTKRGIVRLGFFIKSERARLFRDWAEELIIKLHQQKTLPGTTQNPKQLPGRRHHNRLTPQRIVSIMTDVCRIDDRELRLSITNKLIGGHTQ